MIGATLWAGFSAATGFAVNLMQLGLARIGSGLAKTTNDPTHNSLLADYYPVDVRPSVYSAHQASLNLGNFLGPVIAGVIGLYFTWRLPFFLFAIPTLGYDSSRAVSIGADWDSGGYGEFFPGAVDDVRLLYYVGLQAAQQPEMPRWNPGDEFEAARKAAVEALKK